MTTTPPLPSYGIWTTDIDGKRVMGFTPEQFLTVWQARADMEAAIERKDALLRQAVNMVSQCIRYDFDDEPLDEFDVHAKDLCDAITKELQ